MSLSGFFHSCPGLQVEQAFFRSLFASIVAPVFLSPCSGCSTSSVIGLTSAREKLGIHNRAEPIKFALRQGIIK